MNDGFGKLKQYVPDLKNKSSKVETLRGAIDYIKRLKEMLGEDISDLCGPVSPVTKTEFEDDTDSSSDSLLSPTVTSSTTTFLPSASPVPVKCERSPELASLPQMVCGLPYSDLYTLPSLSPASIPASLASLTPLPPASALITATAWWPETKPDNLEFQS